uniref:ATP-binding cassette sub-family A member 5 n=1 Tax=Lygus hesperus TaxID=30085 RepID=A0A0A9VVP1_LYGHE
MKRKLCLSIAMIGNPKFLLLDEPTSGLDPESRRDIWNVLLGARGSTTIVITTHYMEEADVLADHVALMVNGKLKCYGTTMFLKQHYGVGYLLNCSFQDKDAEQILATVRGYVPTAKLIRQTDKTCLISLPAYEQEKFPSLLQTIGKQADVTLSYSTMDDVFIRVQEDEGVFTTVTGMPGEEENKTSKPPFILHIQQIALLVKRIKWWYYDWKLYIYL